jgi:NADH-quinone oxidoreductase subunit E
VNELAAKYPTEIEAIFAKYPPEYRRSAVMPLLYLAQRQTGCLSPRDLVEVGELTGLSPTEVASLVGFYSLYHDTPGGKYRLQVCTDLPCALRGAEGLLSELCAHLGLQVGATTPDGLLSVEAVTCLAGCHRAPLLQVQSGAGLTYHEHQTVESALGLIESLRAQEQQEPEGPP